MTHARITRYTNCLLCDRGQLTRDDIWVSEGKILDRQGAFYTRKQAPDETIDCQGLILAPGFIDIQVNGAVGVDFSYVTENFISGIEQVRTHLQQFGVTSFCPTIITSESVTYWDIATHIQELPRGPIQGVIGFHYEGPFLNEKYHGAHRRQLLRAATGTNHAKELYGPLDHVSMVTLAPECVPPSLIADLAALGIKVSLGHSGCTYREGLEAVNHGATCVTHLFSAMRGLHHREPALVGLTCAKTPSGAPVYYTMITDGIHSHPQTINLMYRANPAMIVSTDGASVSGLEGGVYWANGQRVRLTEDRVLIEGTDTLAGSVADLVTCLRVMQSATGCSMAEAIATVTRNPATYLGIQGRKGTLAPGSDADFVLLDEDFNVQATFVGGQLKFLNQESNLPVKP